MIRAITSAAIALLLTALASPANACDGDAGLSVVTWNAWGLPSPIAHDRRGRLPRIAEWLEASSYDLVGLQEIWHGAISMLPLPALFPEARGDSGLALVTGHDVTRQALHPFETERGIDGLKAKGLLEADVRLRDGREVVVGVTHLQSGSGGRNAWVRREQVKEILSVLSVDRPVVLMGDFNLYRDDPVDEGTLAHLAEAGFVDAAAQAGALSGTYPGRSDRFDRIFVRDGATRCLTTLSAAVPDPGLSDHRPVTAELSTGTL